MQRADSMRKIYLTDGNAKAYRKMMIIVNLEDESMDRVKSLLQRIASMWILHLRFDHWKMSNTVCVKI